MGYTLITTINRTKTIFRYYKVQAILSIYVCTCVCLCACVFAFSVCIRACVLVCVCVCLYIHMTQSIIQKWFIIIILPNEHCTIKSIVWFRHSSSLVKSNLHDSTKLVNSREHDKLVMTWDDELVKLSLGGSNSPPIEWK